MLCPQICLVRQIAVYHKARMDEKAIGKPKPSSKQLNILYCYLWSTSLMCLMSMSTLLE